MEPAERCGLPHHMRCIRGRTLRTGKQVRALFTMITHEISINTKKALFKVFKRPLILSGLMMVLNLCSLLLGSFYLLSELLAWAADHPRSRSQWRGWMFATLISVNFLVTTFTHQLQFYFGLTAGVKMRGAGTLPLSSGAHLLIHSLLFI